MKNSTLQLAIHSLRVIQMLFDTLPLLSALKLAPCSIDIASIKKGNRWSFGSILDELEELDLTNGNIFSNECHDPAFKLING